jgi:hypothetical protein
MIEFQISRLRSFATFLRVANIYAPIQACLVFMIRFRFNGSLIIVLQHPSEAKNAARIHDKFVPFP